MSLNLISHVLDVPIRHCCACVKVCEQSSVAKGIGWAKIPYTVTNCHADKACEAANQKCEESIKDQERHANTKLMDALHEGTAAQHTATQAKGAHASFKETLAVPEDLPMCRSPWLADPESWECASSPPSLSHVRVSFHLALVGLSRMVIEFLLPLS